MTTLYFVRHADSPYVEGLERERGLSERGIVATEKVRVWLAGEGIDMMISSLINAQRTPSSLWPMRSG
ncbi:hypothetical protein [Paenibacillus sp. JCM 10914]|uniref:hypothetical protein n=1 Tax=Paenibacillus sp. JCM 10914 TaxID=1236974 RepID=UPI0003CC645F|nr:hypothetical protein JCM10914_4815 [Paenibacillus sp. JCM 10914]